MIQSKLDYYDYIKADGEFLTSASGYLSMKGWKRIVNHALRTPLGDKKYIWLFIRTLRKVEYYQNTRKRGGHFLKSIAGYITYINLDRYQE